MGEADTALRPQMCPLCALCPQISNDNTEKESGELLVEVANGLTFIGGLAFNDPLLVDEAKIGTLAGSLISGLLGAAVLLRTKSAVCPVEDRDEAREIFGEDADEDPTVCRR